MALTKDITERDVKAITRGMRLAGAQLEADQVERMWAELKAYREREATTMQLQALEEG